MEESRKSSRCRAKEQKKEAENSKRSRLFSLRPSAAAARALLLFKERKKTTMPIL